METEINKLFIELLQVALGTRDKLSRVPSAREWESIYEEAEKQAIVGVLLDGLERLPEEQLPPLELKLQWIGMVQIIEQRNREVDEAVVALCKEMEAEEIRMLVFKGQTLAVLYPNASLRQSGDIDYYIWKEDWQISIERLEQSAKDGVITNYIDYSTEKDVQYEYNDVAYEMHKMMVSLASPKHRRYWEQVVMPEILAHPWTLKINSHNVPTLAPTYNILYVFVHIFEHLILDGIGLRQFCDLFYLLKTYALSDVEVGRLKKHLQGLGLTKAFTGICAILTDYLGMPENSVPMSITVGDHKKAPALMKNIISKGNFGHNEEYKSNGEVSHSVEHLGRVISQSWKFCSYAPNEILWRVPYMFQWRMKRLWRRMRK